VAEGCDYTCAFCIIPTLRGLGKSRTIASLVAEARALVAGGARELNLVAQDTSDYGRDIGLKDGLPALIRALDEIEDLRWVRLLYLYPTSVKPSLIEAMRASSKVVPYVDMPLQHAHPTMLRAMRRPTDPERYLELFAALREALPSATIRSTFIVGFPGETEEHIDALVSFIERAKLDRVGFFTYSREEGTAAYAMPDQIPMRVKKTRVARCRDVQRRIANANDSARIGETLDVLIEGARTLPVGSPIRDALGARAVCFGRSVREAPNVDGLVYVGGAYAAGEFVRVRVIGNTEFDRYAQPVVAAER
jgi:ribosomal protein S12 methylthiotransferase